MARERRRDVIRQGPAKLIVVVGLPASQYNLAEPALLSVVPGELRVVSQPAPERDGCLYSNAQVISIARALAGFAVRRRTRRHGQPAAPSSIMLMYVPASDDERLLAALDFAVFPLPLTELATRDAKGRQFRHSPDAIRDALMRSAGPTSQARRDMSLIEERLSRLADNEAFLLPPRNYQIDQQRKIDSVFRQFQRRQRAWSDRVVELSPSAFTKREIPRIAEYETRRAFKDHRGLVFLTASPAAYDGNSRVVEGDADADILLHQVRGLYRFGGALPEGFHHDVQRERGAVLGGVNLTCGIDGEVRVGGTHANIYASDFVRAAQKEKI